MRDIEFRVWNTKEKKYFQHFPNCRIDLALRYYETNKHVEYPEQYAGLKDKNGKKIFEGDKLLRHKGEPPSTVEYSKYRGFYLDHKTITAPYTRDIAYAEVCEIIGNIHEEG